MQLVQPSAAVGRNQKGTNIGILNFLQKNKEVTDKESIRAHSHTEERMANTHFVEATHLHHNRRICTLPEDSKNMRAINLYLICMICLVLAGCGGDWYVPTGSDRSRDHINKEFRRSRFLKMALDVDIAHT
jgi:hypothetical protein